MLLVHLFSDCKKSSCSNTNSASKYPLKCVFLQLSCLRWAVGSRYYTPRSLPRQADTSQRLQQCTLASAKLPCSQERLCHLRTPNSYPGWDQSSRKDHTPKHSAMSGFYWSEITFLSQAFPETHFQKEMSHNDTIRNILAVRELLEPFPFSCFKLNLKK